jgi:hypothetical protein
MVAEFGQWGMAGMAWIGGRRRCLMGQGASRHSRETRGGGGSTRGWPEATGTGEAPQRKKRQTVAHCFEAILCGASA